MDARSRWVLSTPMSRPGRRPRTDRQGGPLVRRRASVTLPPAHIGGACSHDERVDVAPVCLCSCPDFAVENPRKPHLEASTRFSNDSRSSSLRRIGAPLRGLRLVPIAASNLSRGPGGSPSSAEPPAPATLFPSSMQVGSVLALTGTSTVGRRSRNLRLPHHPKRDDHGKHVVDTVQRDRRKKALPRMGEPPARHAEGEERHKQPRNQVVEGE